MRWQQALVWLGALTAGGHLIDQVAYEQASTGGAFLALVTFGFAGAYPRIPRLWRVALTVLVGLVWAGAAVRSHLLPVLAAETGPGDLSGVAVVAGGLAMIVAGALAWRE